MNESPPAPAEGKSFGWILIILGAVGAALSWNLRGMFGASNADPGPRAYPLMLSLILLAGGCIEVLLSWRSRRSFSATDSDNPLPSETQEGILNRVRGYLSDRGRINSIWVVIALALYLPALPWLGFGLSTLLLVTAMMRRLGAGWPGSLGTAVSIVLVVQILFVLLFKVQLPLGRLGLPL